MKGRLHSRACLFCYIYDNLLRMNKISGILLLFIVFNSCTLVRLLNTKSQDDESSEEIAAFLKKKKYSYDYSFENIDSTANLLLQADHRINDSSAQYSFIQLRVYDSLGSLYSGYSQCMGNFNKRIILDSLPPRKNPYPFLNKDLKFEAELDLINIDDETKRTIMKEAREYDYTFVVYWNIWTNYFSKHLLKDVSKAKKKYPDKVLVILVNTAIDKTP